MYNSDNKRHRYSVEIKRNYAQAHKNLEESIITIENDIEMQLETTWEAHLRDTYKVVDKQRTK